MKLKFITADKGLARAQAVEKDVGGMLTGNQCADMAAGGLRGAHFRALKKLRREFFQSIFDFHLYIFSFTYSIFFSPTILV